MKRASFFLAVVVSGAACAMEEDENQLEIVFCRDCNFKKNKKNKKLEGKFRSELEIREYRFDRKKLGEKREERIAESLRGLHFVDGVYQSGLENLVHVLSNELNQKYESKVWKHLCKTDLSQKWCNGCLQKNKEIIYDHYITRFAIDQLYCIALAKQCY